MSETLNKLNKISWFVSILAKVCMVLLAIGIVALTAMAVVVSLSDALLAEISDFVGRTIVSGQVLGVFIAAILAAALGIVTLYYIDRFFSNIHKSNTPFSDESVRYMEIIAVLLLISTIAIPAISALLAYAFDSEVFMQFNLIPLFAAFIVYFMSLVFRYGASLQKESDETL